MPRVWLSLGSNLDRESSLRNAISALRQLYGDLVISPVYESRAVGFAGEPFLNLVVGCQTAQSVADLRACLRAIEDAAGRVRGPDKFTPRTLDIDLLTYGDALGIIDGYELPRDEILRYAFVLKPLADVAGEESHPATRRTYRELWRDFRGEAVDLEPLVMDLNGELSNLASRPRIT
ncbi:MAG: 2-amino-4-hydroxy-6-hydroxymethyldihydropteridine diphosphokinase [Chromatiaceae bacterium]